MYAGSGNKITIKRKAAATEESDVSQHDLESAQQGSVGGTIKCITTSQLGYGTSSPKKSSKIGKVNYFSISLICKEQTNKYN